MKSLAKIVTSRPFDIIVFIIISAFVIVKITHANTPYYIDETWSYGPAVYNMTLNGPSLLPGSIPANLSRGHPLLFYFLSSLWLRILGYSIFNAHLFSIFIAAIYLNAVYYFTKKIYGTIPAFVTLLLVALQPIVQAQSAMLLPDMLMALLSILVLQSYLMNKILLFNIFATLLIFVKETGIAVWLSVLLFDCFHRRHEGVLNIFIAQLKLFLVPSIFILLFFMLQKKEFGWYLFPEHTALISHGINMILKRGMSEINFIFLRQGRYAFSILGIIVIILNIVLKKPLYKATRPVIISIVFIVIYILIMSLNFVTWRYMILILAPYFALIVFLTYKILEQKKIYFWLASFLLAGFFLYNTLTEKSPRDVDYGYMNVTSVSKQAVGYFEKMNMYDCRISGFYMLIYLTNPEIGYLSGQRKFTNVIVPIDSATQYLIITSAEKNYIDLSKYNVKEIKSFHKHKAWCKIYEFVK
jgi:hypothetical protein